MLTIKGSSEDNFGNDLKNLYKLCECDMKQRGQAPLQNEKCQLHFYLDNSHYFRKWIVSVQSLFIFLSEVKAES